MSYDSIRVHRDIPVINGFLAMPPNHPGDNTNRTVANLPSGSELLQLTGGSGQQTGSKFGAQQFVRLEGIRPDEWYVTDPLA